MIWTSLACLVEFVNSLLWAGNIKNNLPIWCDICECGLPWKRIGTYRAKASKFLLGAGVGITASTLCISRRLYIIATVQNASISRSDVRDLSSFPIRVS
jgi:pheromone a factor receptor